MGNLCRYGMNEMDGNDFDIEGFIAIGDMLALPRAQIPGTPYLIIDSVLKNG